MRNRVRQAEWLLVIRPRYPITAYLEEQGITTPSRISAPAGLPYPSGQGRG